MALADECSALLSYWLTADGKCIDLSSLASPEQTGRLPASLNSVPELAISLSLQTVEYDGLRREFAVAVPNSLDNSETYPLLVLIHPATSEPYAFASQWLDLAAQENWIILAPSGTLDDGLRPRYQWNGPHFAGEAFEENVDDVGFIGFAIDQVLGQLPINPEQVLAIGMSNGAALTTKLAEPLNQVKGIGVHSGTIGGEPSNSDRVLVSLPLTTPKPIVFVHGLQDEVIDINGGPTTSPFPIAEPRVDIKLLPENTVLPNGSTVPDDGLTSSVEGLTENFLCTPLQIKMSASGYRYSRSCGGQPTVAYVLTEGEHNFFFPGVLPGKAGNFDSRLVIVNELLRAIGR